MRCTTLVVALLVAAAAFAGSPKKYGKALSLKETTKVSEILDNPKAYDGKRVRVEGVVVDVCKKRGCWITLGSDREFESIRFKVEDGVIVFPMDAKGRSAVAEGVVEVREYSVEEQIEQGRHHAEETGEEFDPSTVKEPKVTVRILGEGAIIK